MFETSVQSGLAASLARPGANVTGFTSQLPGLASKRIELLREAAPRVSRVLVIWNPGNPPTAADWKATQAAARALGVTLGSRDPVSGIVYLLLLVAFAVMPLLVSRR